MKNGLLLACLAIVLIGCSSTPTPMPPTQTPWVVTATPIAATSTPWIVTATPLAIPPVSTPGPAASPSKPAVTSANAPTSTPFGADGILWSDAGNFVNQFKKVCGPVMRTTFAQTTNGQPTYLDIGRTYPDPARFSVLIWGSQRASFPSAPETLYRGKTVCVTGKIEMFQGTLEVQVTTPAQIQVK